MIIKGKITDLDLKLIETAFHSSADINIRCGSSHLTGTETVEVYSSGQGDWHLFGGYFLQFALIQADSWESAIEIYIEGYVPCDELDDEDEEGYGYFDSLGEWYNEVTMSYVLGLNFHDYNQWRIELKEGDNYER